MMERPPLSWWQANAERLNLRHVGAAELKGACPACGGTDRFRVNVAGAYCRHCAPDASARDGYRAIIEAAGWNGERQSPPLPPVAAPPKAKPSRTRDYAMRLIDESRPIAGTVAEAYLVLRCLWAARRCRALLYHDGVRSDAGLRPALVVPLAPDFDAEPTGCHAVLLTRRGDKVAKRSFGDVRGSSAWLGSERRPRIAIAEGVENALSAALLAGEPVHPVATMGTAGLAKWTRPAWCEDVRIFADRDGAGATAAIALRERTGAAIRWCEGDANDELRPATEEPQ